MSNKKINKLNKKRDPNNLTFHEHAHELRIRLIISSIIIFICFAVLLLFSKKILHFLSIPISNLGYQLNFYKVHEAFFSTLKASFVAALIISSPIWLFLLIGFIIPAFSRKQKILFIIIIFFCVILMAAGFIFSYMILIPISLNYLLSFGRGEINSVISLEYYLNYFLGLFFATGIGFQLPLVLLFLSKIGLVNTKILSKSRRYVIVVILIISAALTPPDLISQVFLSVPVYVLFEIGLILVYISNKENPNKKNKK